MTTEEKLSSLQSKIDKQRRHLAQQEMAAQKERALRNRIAGDNERLRNLLRRAVDSGWTTELEQDAIREMDLQAIDRIIAARAA